MDLDFTVQYTRHDYTVLHARFESLSDAVAFARMQRQACVLVIITNRSGDVLQRWEKDTPNARPHIPSRVHSTPYQYAIGYEAANTTHHARA